MPDSIDLKHLRTFHAIVEHGSFARAADELGIAQSTVTLHVQGLEGQFGTALFTRIGRSAELTEAGRILLNQATQVLHNVAALQEVMDDVGDGMTGHVRTGVIESAASIFLLPVLVGFMDERPRVQLRVEVGGSSGICDRVLTGDLDFGLCAPPHHPGLTFDHLFDERFVLLLPEDHALAGREPIQVEDLKDQRLLVSEPNCEYRAYVEAALLHHGASPYSGIEIGTIVGLKRAVQAGLGAAILPVASVTPTPARTVVRELEGVTIKLEVGIVQRQEQGFASPALRALLDCIREELKGPAAATLASAVRIPAAG